MASERALRERLCEVARILYERGHNAPPDGNLSVRLSERYLLCTPSMRHKGRLSAGDVVKVALRDGREVDSAQRASSELRMHLAIFHHRPDVAAIVHAHSPHAVGLTVAGVSMARPVVPEAILALGGVPTVPYASPTTADVGEAAVGFVHRYNAFILERHGPVALGATLDEAFSRLEVVEHTAKITVAALAAGGAQPIPEAEAARLRQMAVQAGILRDPEGAPPSLGSAPRRPRGSGGSDGAGEEDLLVEALATRVVERILQSGTRSGAE